MMDDLEERLRRYRPAGPPSALRARVIVSVGEAAREPRGSIVAWFPAAAAAIVIVLFSWMSSMERGRIDAHVPQAIDDSASALATEIRP
jgi:anti-sigma factor RsiW